MIMKKLKYDAKCSLFEAIKRIELKPGIYLDGDKSIKRLRSLLVGYSIGLAVFGEGFVDEENMEKFEKWVAKKLGYPSRVKGWSGMILEFSNENDSVAYENFMRFFKEFQESVRS
jgi:hypothetical protein